MGSGAVYIYVIRHMSNSKTNYDCAMYLLQEKTLSKNAACRDSNKYMIEIFKYKNMSVYNPEDLKAVERQIVDLLFLKFNRR